MVEQPTVVDLFCGGGGFSEGFRQAGFDITHAVDIDSGAVETHELNHPETETIQADITDLDPADLPQDVDVLIGSPPCTEFSFANSGGGGDIEKGMELVARYLHFVAELEPTYWVMENVPRLDNFLEDEYTYEALGLDRTGALEIPVREVLSANEYGAPQRRNRLFSGDFPLPDPIEESALSFGEVQDRLPTPTAPQPDGPIADPIDAYDITLAPDELTDHFYISHLTEREAKEIKVRKVDHSFYGTMQFPDDPSVPSRTVLATNRRVARETLVMEEAAADAPDRFSQYRKPTIREIGTIQGFPITYQFTGTSIARKWNRVGDAVPVPLAYEIAVSIREALIEDSLADPSLAKEPRRVREQPPAGDLGTDLNDKDLSNKGRRKLSISRSFRHHVPYDTKTAFRVDLETDKDRQPTHPLADVVTTDEDDELTHPVGFFVTLYKGYSKDVQSTPVDLPQARDLLETLLDQHPHLANRVHHFLDDLNAELAPMVPDATTLQAIRSRRSDIDRPLEYEILEAIAAHRDDSDAELGVVDVHFPYNEFADTTVKVDLLDGTDLPVRVLMKAVAANYVAHKLDHCGRWIDQNRELVHAPDSADGNLLDSGTPDDIPCVTAPEGTDCIEAWVADLVSEEGVAAIAQDD